MQREVQREGQREGQRETVESVGVKHVCVERRRRDIPQAITNILLRHI